MTLVGALAGVSSFGTNAFLLNVCVLIRRVTTLARVSGKAVDTRDVPAIGAISQILPSAYEELCQRCVSVS